MWHWEFLCNFHRLKSDGFSLRIHSNEFRTLKIPMHDDLQKDISSLETLAQIVLVYIVIHNLPGCRVPIRMSTLSDNTSAESVFQQIIQHSNASGFVLGKIICVNIILHCGSGC